MSNRSEFTLTIRLGNAAMTEPEHVAQALREVADRLARHGETQSRVGPFASALGAIRDVNGNTVGAWEYLPPPRIDRGEGANPSRQVLNGWTNHGHPISDVPLLGSEPTDKARCGGERLCSRCAIDAAQARELFQQ